MDPGTLTAVAPPAPADVEAALRTVLDPELGADLVELNMIGEVRLDEDGHCRVEVGLTIAGCPLRTTIERDVVAAVSSVEGVTSVEVVTTLLEAAAKERVMSRARALAVSRGSDTIDRQCRILAVGSGKGGVGKSSVAVNLAVALARRGRTVGLLDADIWGFSVPRLLGLTGEIEARDKKMLPLEQQVGTGLLKVLSMGFLAGEDRAIMWRGLKLARAVQQFVEDAAWGPLDDLVVDLPPGTGDVAMSLARVLPRAQLLLVTTPPAQAQAVAARAADMARRGYLPVAGVIENMADFTCEHGTTYALFGSGGGARLAEQLGVPLLGSIPLDPQVAAAGDAGKPVAAGDGPLGQAFAALATAVDAAISVPAPLEGCSARLLDAIEAAVESA